MQDNLIYFFNPQGVAVVGASSNSSKLSHGILRNLISYDWAGKAYPVNPSTSKILELPCYPSIKDVPDPLDLAVIILPAEVIPNVLEDCGKRGVKAVIVISGGFREVGEGGLALENECLTIIRNYGMKMIGPNCVGTMNVLNGLNTTFIRGMPAKGGIGFLSQSGAVCGGIVDHVVKKGFGFSHFISLGNEADVNETDIIEFLAKDENTRVIAAYVESIYDGQRFLKVCQQVSRIKPIVIIKAGRTSEGAKAVSSHTGALAGVQQAYSAAFKQAGLIEVKTVEDLLNVAMTLDYCPLPTGNRAAIVTNAGGPAALASDHLADNGVSLAHIDAKTKSELRGVLTGAAQVDNPIDMLGAADAGEYGFALQQVLKDDGVDLTVPILVPQALVNPSNVAEAIVNQSAKKPKPVIACLMGDESIDAASKILHDGRVPMVDYPEKIGACAGALVKYSEWKTNERFDSLVELPVDKRQAKVLLGSLKEKVLGERFTRQLLNAYGIPLVPGDFAETTEEAIQLARHLSYPVALKVVSTEILHKSEAQGILLDIKNEEELKQGWAKILHRLEGSSAKVKVDGFMVEAMAQPGQEVIIGMKRDPNFGALLMFGLGGVIVEVFQDVAFRIAPLTERDAHEMLQETKAFQLLKGFRAKPAADLSAIVDCLLRLGQLSLDLSEVEEIEINPLIVYPKGALAVDCRMILN